MGNKRILLDQDDFRKLTNGEIVTKDNVDIALSDIGWDNMITTIYDNIEKRIIKK